ncbi:Uncharacterised protein [Clostridioides difficile]|nr:Uncharacterised protein [Clostridioides difficile]
MEVDLQKAYMVAFEEIKVLYNELILYKAIKLQQQEEIDSLKKEIEELKQDKNKEQ